MAKCKLIRPSIPAKITGEILHLAWTNPNPAQAFPATDADRTITLDTDDYDNILVIGAISGGLYDICTIARKGDSRIALSYANTSSGSYTTNGIRIINVNSATSLYVNDAMKQNSNGTRTTDNNQCIPLAIYTFKKTLTVNVNAIASSVKTNAQNCMMSDGMTSVEDELYYKSGDYIDLTVQDYLYGLYYTNYLNLHLPLVKPVAPNVVGATLTNLPSSFGVGTVYGLRSADNASVSAIRIASTCIEITIRTDVMNITEYSPLVVGITGRLTFY